MSKEMNKEVEVSSITYKINRETLINLIQCAIGDTSSESLIKPMVAVKIIDTVFLFKHREPVSMEVAYASVREWYKVPITSQPITPFNNRTKSIDEIIVLLEKHYDLQSIMID